MAINLKKLPFTYHWILTKQIGQSQKLLDLGCGEGDFMSDLALGSNWEITGIELYSDSIKKAKQKKIYKKVIQADITKLKKNKTKYEVVLASQVIEHLPKNKGKKLLPNWEEMATEKIIITTPNGFIPFHQIERDAQDKNPLQKHLSGWDVADFEDRGYKIYGQGIKFIYGIDGLGRKVPKTFLPFLSAISYLLSPIPYFFPEMGTYLIAVKDIHTN